MEENMLIENIKSKIQRILDRKFAGDSYVKRKIDVYHDRISFSCPFCNDSRLNDRKKRGNLYLNGLHFHCFNCGEHVGIGRFLREFNESLSTEETVAVREIQQNSKRFERRNSSNQSSIVYSVIEELAVPKGVFFERMGLVTPYRNEECGSYLKGRMIDIRKWGCFAYRPESKELFILNLTNSDRIIGYQIRQLDTESTRPRYLTFNITRMYRDVFGVQADRLIERSILKRELGARYIEEEDGIENIVANIEKISGIFNVMRIDTGRMITVVEGPIDSLAIDNCVALQGARKMNDYFDGVDNVRYLFDKDTAGKEETIKKLKKHKKVFLWELYLKRGNVRCKVKDLNDLQRTGNFRGELIDECFSDDELDIVMV